MNLSTIPLIIIVSALVGLNAAGILFLIMMRSSSRQEGGHRYRPAKTPDTGKFLQTKAKGK